MRIKKTAALLLGMCILLSTLFSGICFADAEKTVLKGTYTVLGSTDTSIEGAKVFFVREDGLQKCAQAYEKDGIGSFAIQLEPGNYDVTVSRKGYLESTVRGVSIDNRTVTLETLSLTAGDLNGDGVIDADDIFVFDRNAYTSLSDVLDLNGDGKIDEKDEEIIMQNKNKQSEAAEYTNVRSLLCDNRENPIGIDIKSPTLSWKLDSVLRGQKQTGYRIVVSSSREALENGIFDIWDYSAKSEDMSVSYGGSALAARTRYYWTVFVSDKDGNVIAPCTVAYFETGLFGDFGAENYWISNGNNASFDITSGTLDATMTLTACAVGLNFFQTADSSAHLMWQINVTSGKVMFRPHVQRNGGWSCLTEIDLSNIFPSAADMAGNPFNMKLVFGDGKIVTYINGTQVYSYSDTGRNVMQRFGTPECRIAGSEQGALNAWTLYDADGNTLFVKTDTPPYAAILFRKGFSTEEGKTLYRARLYVTAAGTHEMYLNGKRCSDDYLAPGKSEFNQVLYYQTYDVKDQILSGENTLACRLGMGWYNGGPIGSNYGTNIGLKAKLILSYTDGTEQIIDSDNSWRATVNGPVTQNYFYLGEIIDGRKNIDGWNENGLDETGWDPCSATETIGKIQNNLVGENTEPIRVIRTAHPIAVTNPAENVYVYKFPANMSATLSVKASAPSGTSIKFRYAEMLDSRGFADVTPFIVKEAMGDQNGEDEYIFAGDENGEEFTFSLVYHGFQYVEISGLSEPLPFGDITALLLSTDSARSGSFSSSNMLLNRFYENTIRSQESNFVGAITDCPTREKNNWTGDAQGFAYAATYNFNTANIYRSFQEMTRHTQGTSGIIPEVIPLIYRPEKTVKAPSGWSDTVILIPWQLYFQYGDESFLTDSYDEMKKWADFLINSCKDYDYVRQVGWYGDNVSYDRYMMDSKFYPEIGTAYSAYSIGILSKICGILGKTEDEAYYKAESENFAAAWRENFLEEDGFTCKTKDQTAYAMGIYYNLYESEEKRQKAADALDKLIHSPERDGIPKDAQTVGFIGYPILYYTLSQHGHTDTAFTLLERTDNPSILYPVTLGATTTWERYKKICSLNHFFPGCVTSWFYTDILGITHDYETENVGYRHFILQPTYGGSLTWAKGSYDSASGIIESAWTLADDGTFTFDCTIPANTSATVKLPANASSIVSEGGELIGDGNDSIRPLGYVDGRMCFEVTSGEYHFTVTEGQ